MRLVKTGRALTTATLAALALTARSSSSDTPEPAGSMQESAMMSPEPSDAMMSPEPSDTMMSEEPSDTMMKESPDAMMSDDSAS